MNIDDDAEHRWANTLLTRAVGAEPELGFEAEEVLARVRRARGQRRAALTGALTLTALAAIGLLLGHGGSPRPTTQVGHVGSAGASPAASNSPTETTVYGVEGPLVVNAHARTLTTELAAAHLVPSGVTAGTDTSYGGQPLVFYKLITGQYTNSYYAQATLTDSHGAGHLVVQVLNQQTGVNCVGISDPKTCHTETLADGSRITARRYAPSTRGKPIIQWMVELVRPNGTAVDALCGNWSLDGDPATGGTTHATGAEPPLAETTLVRLVQLPGLIP